MEYIVSYSSIVKDMFNKIMEVSNNTNKNILDIKDEIKKDVGDISSRIDEISVTQAKQQEILKEHIRRTEINEECLKELDGRIKPIEAHIAAWAGAGKLLAVLVTILTAIAAVYKLAG